METKAKNKRMERIKSRIGMANGLFVPCVSRKGGLAMLWARDVDLEIKSYSLNHIDAVINDTESSYKWRLTGFYGHPETHRRYESWHFLAFLNNQLHLPWLCLGDFNEILTNSEKQGGAIRSQQQMDGFRKVVDYCAFKDLGYYGSDFTWCNMQDGENRIYLRLDRALANLEWIEKFGGMKAHHVVDSTSDHCALLISDPTFQRQSRAKRFHFEAMWAKNAECKTVIENSWGMNLDLGTPEGIMSNLFNCAVELKKWSSKTFGQIPKKI